jgi:hypothetical protein
LTYSRSWRLLRKWNCSKLKIKFIEKWAALLGFVFKCLTKGTESELYSFDEEDK